MADFRMAVVRQAIRTDTGLETFTVSGFGTPKAAIFIPTLCTADSTLTVDAAMGWGVTDGTGNFGIAVADEDGLATSNTQRAISSTKCLYALVGAGTLAYEGDFDSFNTDNVVIDITNNNAGVAAFVTCILIGGDDVAEAGVGTYTNENGGNTFNGLGFSAAPSLVFLGNIASNATSGIATQASYHLGVVDFINSNQAGSTWGSNNNASTQRANQETFEAGTTASSQAQSISDATQWESYLDTPVAAGWDVNINSGSPGGDVTVYLALTLTNSPAIQVFTDTMPTATGSFDYSGASFTPGFLYGMMTENTAFDTFASVAGASLLTADADNQYCNSMSVEDGATVMNNGTISGATMFDSLNEGSTESYVGTLTEFTSDGYDAEFSVAEPSTGLKMWGLLIEEADEAGNTLTAESVSYTYTPTAVDLQRGINLVTESVSYTYTPTDVTLTFTPVGDFTLTAESVSYSYTATAIDFQVDRVLVAESTAYNYAVTDINLLLGSVITTETVPYTYSVTDADLNLGQTLTADTVAYTYTVTDAGLLTARVLSADSVSYTYSVTDIALPSSSDPWTVQADSSTSWSAQANAATTWTNQTDSSTTWTVQ